VPDRIPEQIKDIAKPPAEWSQGDIDLVRSALAAKRCVYSSPPFAFGPPPRKMGFIPGLLQLDTIIFVVRCVPILLARSVLRLFSFLLCMRCGAPPDEVTNFWADFWFRLRNTHTILSMFLVHKLNPLQWKTLALNCLATALWSYFVNYVNGLITEESNYGNPCKNVSGNCDVEALRATQIGQPKSGIGPIFAATIIGILLKEPWSLLESMCIDCSPFGLCLKESSIHLQRLRTVGFYFFATSGLPLAMVLFLLAVCYTQGGPAVAIGNWAVTFFGSTCGTEVWIASLIFFAKGYRTEIEWRRGMLDTEAPAEKKSGCLSCGGRGREEPAIKPTEPPAKQVMQPPTPVSVLSNEGAAPAQDFSALAAQISALEDRFVELKTQTDLALLDCASMKLSLQMEDTEAPATDAAMERQRSTAAAADPRRIPSLRL
jgi:hypothetical protein